MLNVQCPVVAVGFHQYAYNRTLDTKYYALLLSIHCWMTSTAGLVISSLYFLTMSPIFCCNPWAFSSLMFCTRLKPALRSTGTHSSPTPTSAHSATLLCGIFFSGFICGKNNTS